MLQDQDLPVSNQAINATNVVTCYKFLRFLPASECSKYDDESNDSQLKSPLLECVVKLVHSSYTDLEWVGLQIWNGALLLSEFVIHCGNTILHNKNVLELASGTGLVGIIAGMYCSHVTFTDLDDTKVLQNIRRNIDNNQHLINASVSIKPFDFYDDWSTAEVDICRIVSGTEIILVSEVIYDNRLTDAFIEQLVRITNANPKIYIYIAVEKRYIFSALNLRTEATHYEYFFERIRAKQRILNLNWNIKRIEIDFPQYFNYYRRSKHLQIWRISKTENPVKNNANSN